MLISTGVVTGTDYVGGLVGRNDCQVHHCYSAAVASGEKFVGGLVGENWGYCSVSQCYSIGAVSGKDSVGGLVGKNDNTTATVRDCFWDVQTSGQSASAGGAGLATAEMQDPNTLMAAGWDFVGKPDGPHDLWAEPEGGGYPILWWQLSPWPSLPTFSGGTGEPNDPYLISSPEQLSSIGHNPRLMKYHLKLISDLDTKGTRFYPIGDLQYPYDAVFDGNGHTISNLTVTGVDYLGLFGSVREVKDLGLVDVNIVGSGNVVGGLAGSAYTVISCYSTGIVKGADAVGGLLGGAGGSVIQCYSSCAVTGTDSVGGLIGSTSGTVIQCYNTGPVSGKAYVGGLVGWNSSDGAVLYSYSTGTVSGDDFVGGLVGTNSYDYLHEYLNVGLISQCYSAGKVSGTSHVGGLVGDAPASVSGVAGCLWDTQASGQALSAGGTGKTTAEMQDPNTFSVEGWDFAGHGIWIEPESGAYPLLWWQRLAWPNLPSFSGGTGESDNPYRISKPEELNSIGRDPRLLKCHFKLDNDLDLAGSRFYCIGDLDCPYEGVFDGNGHAIRHLNLSGGSHLGLLGCLGSDAEVKDLRLIDAHVAGSGNYVGCLVGLSYGRITRCYSNGAASGAYFVGGLVGYGWRDIIQCHSSSAVDGDLYVGGLMGWNYSGTIRYCCSTGKVSGNEKIGGLVGQNGNMGKMSSVSGRVSDCYSASAISGNRSVGGLVGYNSWGEVTDSYSIGAVSASERAGGLVGWNLATVTQCFWDTETSGQATSAGGTGKTTAEMQTASTFLDAGWDFVGETANGSEDLWWINEGKDYPRLWWDAAKN